MCSMEEYVSRIIEAVGRNECVVLGCTCEVRFSGRAQSFLASGDRIVLIKSDNTVIVHQPVGNAPVNYMKPSAAIHVFFEADRLVLQAQNLVLKDYMDIIVHRLHFFSSGRLENGASIIVTGTERDMADMIYANPSLIEHGFKPVSMEEQTKYGFIDVFGYDKSNVLTVVECKRYVADLKAVDQLRRYVEKVKKSKGVHDVRGILASPRISSNAEKMLKDFGFCWVSVNPPSYLERFGKAQKSLNHFG
jgi:RecB family endonuclease NucS